MNIIIIVYNQLDLYVYDIILTLGKTLILSIFIHHGTKI